MAGTTPGRTKTSLRRSSFTGFRRCHFVMMLSRIKAEDVLSLTRARIDGADMLATLHFPNSRYHAVFLYGVIGNLLGACRCGCCALVGFNSCAGSLVGVNLRGGGLVCINRWFGTHGVANGGLVLRHLSVVLLLENSNSELGRVGYPNCCTRPRQCPAR